MVTYVLDSSALLRYLHNEPGAQRVSEIMDEHIDGVCEAIVSAPHWGEVAGITYKLYGRPEMEQVLSRLTAFGLPVIAADASRSVRAAVIKVDKRMPYVDAFGVELAGQVRDRVFVTADFDFKGVARDVSIEFLPRK